MATGTMVAQYVMAMYCRQVCNASANKQELAVGCCRLQQHKASTIYLTKHGCTFARGCVAAFPILHKWPKCVMTQISKLYVQKVSMWLVPTHVPNVFHIVMGAKPCLQHFCHTPGRQHKPLAEYILLMIVAFVAPWYPVSCVHCSASSNTKSMLKTANDESTNCGKEPENDESTHKHQPGLPRHAGQPDIKSAYKLYEAEHKGQHDCHRQVVWFASPINCIGISASMSQQQGCMCPRALPLGFHRCQTREALTTHKKTEATAKLKRGHRIHT